MHAALTTRRDNVIVGQMHRTLKVDFFLRAKCGRSPDLAQFECSGDTNRLFDLKKNGFPPQNPWESYDRLCLRWHRDRLGPMVCQHNHSQWNLCDA